ncbi:MAG: hypothetical protein FJW31_10520 [Acidobacteria bacterium]|nr:hypothetical protein [Acidobacteriota bacterium]
MQHFRVKIFAQPVAVDFDPGPAIAVFHRWIQESELPELLIDVADYRHVPDGPGIVLMAHDAVYALDQTKGRLGLLYTRRSVDPAETAPARLQNALAAAHRAASLLEAEPEFAGRLRFEARSIEVSVNDRLLAPNTDASFAELEPVLRVAVDAEWGAGSYRVERSGSPRELLTATVSA